jgi:hypothetical protein
MSGSIWHNFILVAWPRGMLSYNSSYFIIFSIFQEEAQFIFFYIILRFICDPCVHKINNLRLRWGLTIWRRWLSFVVIFPLCLCLLYIVTDYGRYPKPGILISPLLTWWSSTTAGCLTWWTTAVTRILAAMTWCRAKVSIWTITTIATPGCCSLMGKQTINWENICRQTNSYYW